MHRIVDVSGAIVDIHAHGEIDEPLVARHLTIEPGHVTLPDLAQREESLQRRERGRVLGRQQQARGVEIEAMHHQLSGGVGVARPQPRGHRIAQESAATGHRQQSGRFVDDDEKLVFEHDPRLGLGDSGGTEHRRRISRQSAQHVRKNGGTLPLAGGIERAGATIPRARRGAPPELGQRQRTQPLRVGLREQLRRRAIAGAPRWFFGREQLAQRAHLAQRIGEVIRVLNRRQQFARARGPRVVVGAEVVQFGLTGNPDRVARRDIVRRRRPAIDHPLARHHAGEGP